MLINSVANNWDTPDRVAVTGGVSQNFSTSVNGVSGRQGLLSVLVMFDVDTHIAKSGPSSTSKFLLLANTYFEIPVADLKTFAFFGTAAGFMYALEWLG